MNSSLKTLGRVYFIVLIPFVVSALAPWILGPQIVNDMSLFALWSFAVLIFISGALWGRASQQTSWAYIHGLVSCCLAAAAVLAVVIALKTQSSFTAIAILAVLHWGQSLWIRRTVAAEGDFYKQFNRFIGTILICHMFVLFNLIYALKKGLS